MLTRWKFPLTTYSTAFTKGFHCRAQSSQVHASTNGDNNSSKKNVIILGSGWSGLGAAHHLCNQGFDVTVIEDGNGLGSPDNAGIQGFWYPFKNIFSIVDELGIEPFTGWMKSAQYSAEGLEVVFPVFKDQRQLPAPLGTLYYSQFTRLPVLDRLTLLPLMAAVIDFDNTDVAWRRYDSITARELLKQFGCSDMLYRNIFGPLLQVGLYAPAEQCSAAAMLGMLYYISLAHQKNFDVSWCRGSVKEKIFDPWIDSLKSRGCRFLENSKVTDFGIDEETSCISEVVCGDEYHRSDAVILAVGISTLQELVKNSTALSTREEFLKVLNLADIDMLSVKLFLDKKINIPNASNACSGFDDSYGWTFFDLNAIHDEHKDSPATVVQADFYHANELLALEDERIVAKTLSYLSNCVKDFEMTAVVDAEIRRLPKSLTHFFPGSYKNMMKGSTSFGNMFMAGDWIISRHGSWSQEKSYVSGLEAANRVVDFLEEGNFAKIIPVEADEPHIEALRSINRRFYEIKEQLPLSDFFLQ